MKVFILCMFLLMPDGTEKVSMVRVPSCPDTALVQQSLKKLQDDGTITSARAACGPVDMGGEA